MTTVDGIERRLQRLENKDPDEGCDHCTGWVATRVFDERDGVRVERVPWGHPDACPVCGWEPVNIIVVRGKPPVKEEGVEFSEIRAIPR